MFIISKRFIKGDTNRIENTIDDLETLGYEITPPENNTWVDFSIHSDTIADYEDWIEGGVVMGTLITNMMGENFYIAISKRELDKIMTNDYLLEFNNN